MVGEGEDPEIASLFSLLAHGDPDGFFEILPRALERHGRALLSGERGEELAALLVPHLRGEAGRTRQQRFVSILARGIPGIDDRKGFYDLVAKALGAGDPGDKDRFLVTLCLEEGSREIARFAYLHADPHGDAHYTSVFYFLTGTFPVRPPPPVALRKPRVTFTAEREVHVVVPRQGLAAVPGGGEVRVVISSAPWEGEQAFALDLYREGDGIATGEREEEVPPWEGTLSVRIACGGEVLRTWEIPGITVERPLLAFRAGAGTLVTAPNIPRERTWVVSRYPVLYEDGVLERGRASGRWREYSCALIDPLPHREYYLKTGENATFRVPFEPARRCPSLAGTRVEGAIVDPPVPWYAEVPRLVIPLPAEPGETAGTVVISRVDGAGNEVPVASFPAGEAGDHARVDEETRTLAVDLSSAGLLGPSAAGQFVARFSAWEAPLRFGIAPGLRVLCHPPFLLLDGAQDRALEIEVAGPSRVEPLDPCEEVREGLFRVTVPRGTGPAAATFAFRVSFHDGQGDPATGLALRARLPLVRCTLEGLGPGKEPLPLGPGVTLCVEDVETALGTAGIVVERPAEIAGSWTLSAGEQESRRCTVDDEGNLRFPLERFREIILAQRNDPLPVALAHEDAQARVQTRVPLLSLVGWKVEYTGERVEFRDGKTLVTVSWRERGRSGEAKFVLSRGEGGIPSGEELGAGVRVAPPGIEWKEYSESFMVPFADAETVCTAGFVSARDVDGEWGTVPALRFPRRIRVKGDPLEVAEWYFARGEIEACTEWLAKVTPGHPRHADALVLRARCLASRAEGAPSPGEAREILSEAIGNLARALEARGDDDGIRVFRAHLHNRLGLAGDGDPTPFREAEGILGEVLGRNPRDITAIGEYGIALAGMGRVLEAIGVSRFLEHLDRGETTAETAYARAMIRKLHAERVKGKVGESDQREIGRLLARARELRGTADSGQWERG